jgi:hypothetical protein
VLWSRQQWKAIQILASTFELERSNETIFNISYYPYDFLERLEEKLQHILKESGEEYFHDINESVVRAVKTITYSELSSLSYGIDYNLELRNERELISEENYPVVYYCLVKLPKINDEGLLNENHGKGYHIHYVILQNKKQERANIVFTFNPSEISTHNNIVYCEHHGSGVSRDPSRFGKRRRNAIYDTSCNFLSKISKREFRAPVSSANVLWPQ